MRDLDDAVHVLTYALYDRAGRPIFCHLCSQTDQWVMERDGMVFVCEHEPLPLVRGVLRQLSSVPADRVAVYECAGMKTLALPSSSPPPWYWGI